MYYKYAFQITFIYKNMNNYQKITNEFEISTVCEICETICENSILLEPLNCGHVFHYHCLVIGNLNKINQCRICKSKYKELFYYSSNNIHTRVMVKNYDHEFRL